MASVGQRRPDSEKWSTMKPLQRCRRHKCGKPQKKGTIKIEYDGVHGGLGMHLQKLPSPKQPQHGERGKEHWRSWRVATLQFPRLSWEKQHVDFRTCKISPYKRGTINWCNFVQLNDSSCGAHKKFHRVSNT